VLSCFTHVRSSPKVRLPAHSAPGRRAASCSKGGEPRRPAARSPLSPQVNPLLAPSITERSSRRYHSHTPKKQKQGRRDGPEGLETLRARARLEEVSGPRFAAGGEGEAHQPEKKKSQRDALSSGPLTVQDRTSSAASSPKERQPSRTGNSRRERAPAARLSRA